MSRSILSTITMAVALYGVIHFGAVGTIAATGPSSDANRIRVLLITGGHDFEQQPFYALFDSMPDVVTTKTAYPAAADLFRPELAADYDVIVFYDMWAQGITPQQQAGLVQLLQRGIGVVALHHTLAAHKDWPEYARIIGGKYYTEDTVVDGRTIPRCEYQHDQDIPVTVADTEHPITRGLTPFQIHDETYKGYDVDPNSHVLLTTDHPQSSKQLAWVRTHENSRVFYMQLGHDHFAYEHPSFRQLVTRAIRWTAGRPADPDAAPLALFNGRDLAGWKPEGAAKWEVRDGLLVGQQGPGNTPGDLLTEASFADFEVEVVFRVQWPANSGVWYRYQSADQAYQADILEYKDPAAWTGTLYGTGKMFLAVNEDPKLVNREGWNSLLIRAVGTRQIVLLNGVQVADVRSDISDHGRIGFQVHPGAEFGPMQIVVKEVRLRPL